MSTPINTKGIASIENVMVEEERILGKVYENGAWVEKEFPFTDVIYNASAPPNAEAEEVYDFLYDIIPSETS